MSDRHVLVAGTLLGYESFIGAKKREIDEIVESFVSGEKDADEVVEIVGDWVDGVVAGVDIMKEVRGALESGGNEE